MKQVSLKLSPKRCQCEQQVGDCPNSGSVISKGSIKIIFGLVNLKVKGGNIFVNEGCSFKSDSL